VENSAGETLSSTWPFAGTKCSAWPVSIECPVSQASTLVTLNLRQYRTPLSCRRLLIVFHTKTQGLQKPSVPHIKNETYVQECLHMCLPIRSSGVCNMWSVSRQVSLDTTERIIPRSSSTKPSHHTELPRPPQK
jgi:hypothetical protein